jgi:hypothetical protein
VFSADYQIRPRWTCWAAPGDAYDNALAESLIGLSCRRGSAWSRRIAPGLTASFGSIGIGVMLPFLGALSLVCTYALAETRGVALAHEQIDLPPVASPVD